MNPLDATKRQVLYSTGQFRDCCLRSSYDFSQRPEHCSPTKYARVSSCSHGDVVMLFCSSFTQSERFLQTDQLIRLRSCSHDKLHSHVDEKRVRERVQVRCSDLVGSDLPLCRDPLGRSAVQNCSLLKFSDRVLFAGVFSSCILALLARSSSRSACLIACGARACEGTSS